MLVVMSPYRLATSADRLLRSMKADRACPQAPGLAATRPSCAVLVPKVTVAAPPVVLLVPFAGSLYNLTMTA